METTRRRRLATRLAAAFFGMLGSVVVIEALPRLAPELMPPSLRAVERIHSARHAWEDMMQGDSELGFALRPGLDFLFPSEGRKIRIRTKSLGTDGLGFRDIGTQAPFDAVAVGDSFTFCDDAPAESCWVRRLADATGLSIATLGVNGYSTLAEARLLARVGPLLRPRLVLLGVFPNDFKDNVYFAAWTRSGTDDYWLWMRRRRRSDLSELLTRRSVLYRLLDSARRYRRRKTYRHHENGLDFVFRADAWWRRVVRDPRAARGWPLMQQGLRDIQASTRSMRAELVVLLFPFKEQVYWDILRRYQPDAASLDVDAPLRMVAEFCRLQGIAYCDLTEPLRAEARRGRQLYLRISAHWNDAGNEVAAGAIRQCLAERGLLREGGARAPNSTDKAPEAH